MKPKYQFNVSINIYTGYNGQRLDEGLILLLNPSDKKDFREDEDKMSTEISNISSLKDIRIDEISSVNFNTVDIYDVADTIATKYNGLFHSTPMGPIVIYKNRQDNINFYNSMLIQEFAINPDKL